VAFALRFAYDGCAFDSYARQPGRYTVEGALLDALQAEGLVEGSLRTGSRTDAGVSALENVCRIRLERDLKGLVPSLQKRLPPGLWATGAAVAPEGFDPRRAQWRQYRYIAPDRGEREDRLQEATKAFLGRHHMGAFARLEAGRDPMRVVDAFEAKRRAGHWELRVRGQSFLWGQVRRMVDAALAVGRGEAEAGDITASLASGRPHARFGVAPAEGLLLERVHYGLRWSPEAGTASARHVRPVLVQAHARLRLARHLARIAK
jgi:tRNA pseudouridine38-40 synthase